MDAIPGFISIGMDDGPAVERTSAPSFGKSYKEQRHQKGYNFARENDIYSSLTSEHDSTLHKEIDNGELNYPKNEMKVSRSMDQMKVSRSMDQIDRRIDNAHNSRRHHGGGADAMKLSRPRRISVPPKNIGNRHARTPPRRISVPPRRQPRRSSIGHQKPYNPHESNHHNAEHNDHHGHGNNHNATWDRHDGEQQRGHDNKNMPSRKQARNLRRSTMGHQNKYNPQDGNQHHHNGGEYNEHHGNNGEQQHDNNNAPPRRRQQRRRSNESHYNPKAEPMPRPSSSIDNHLEQQQRIKKPSRMKSLEQPRRPDGGRRSPHRRNSMGTMTTTTNREAATASPAPDSNNQGLLSGMKYAVDPLERLNPMARKLMEARKLRKARQHGA